MSDQRPESPCVRNCCLNEQDVCLGCFRSLKEILRWGPASNEERKEILENTRPRREEHELRRLSWKHDWDK